MMIYLSLNKSNNRGKSFWKRYTVDAHDPQGTTPLPVRLNIHLPVEGGFAVLQWPVQLLKLVVVRIQG